MEAVVRTQVCAVRTVSMVHSSDRRQDHGWVGERWGADEPGQEELSSISVRLVRWSLTSLLLFPALTPCPPCLLGST